ncbi:hypothetical protein CDV55_100409 [Aspergillus turcosus]|nr:hypothetical protein CDV55_100409 [Aspergillus turcosus]
MKNPTHIIDPNGDVIIRLLNPNAPFAVSEEWDYGEDEELPSWFGSRQWNPLNNEQAVDSLLDLTVVDQDDQNESPKSAASETNVALLAVTGITGLPTRRQRRRPRRMSEGEFILNEYTRKPAFNEEYTYQVSSRHLILASPFFRIALTGGWKETHTLGTDGSVTFTVHDWDEQALLIFLNIIHGHHRNLPWKVGLELLAKITVIADYYQCIDAIQFMALSWYAFLKPTCSATVRPRDIVLWLWVSWVLRLPDQFREAGSKAMRQLDQRMDSLGLPIPRRILDAINHQEGFPSSLQGGDRLLFWWLYRGWPMDRHITMYTSKSLLSALIPILIPLSLGSISSPNLLPTPPMGFNNWARFMCDLNETLFLETASAMISTGLLEAGYNRLNLDDCWMAYDRAPNSSLQWNTTKFPHGIPWLAHHLKSLGFHLGIYQDAGNLTCGGYPGSFGHEALDAQTFAAWGIDYLKLDGCNVFPTHSRTLEQEYKARYAHWHDILRQMHPPLIFSESAPAYFADPANQTSWYEAMDWVPRFGELARHSTDILVYSGLGSAWDSIMVNYHYNTLLARYQRPGYFNDPDFLIPDHPGLRLEEKRSQFALWASFSAPLIVSAFIPGLSGEELAILGNEELIRVDQDALGLQATLASRGEEVDVLTRSLEGGDRLVTVLNRGDGVAVVRVPVEWMGLERGCAYMSRSLWDGEVQMVEEEVMVRLNSHATEVYRITLLEECSSVIPTGIVFNTASGNCLTDGDGGSVGFEACKGSETQIWQISIQLCTGHQDQKWTYEITGNLKNEHTNMCLTEGGGISECGFELDSQVFGLPSGVDIKSG